MTERSYTTIDKSGWGDGPWHDEPDKVQWIDDATGFDCLARRGPMGNWCGYVGVPPGHPAHGRDYDDVTVDVHGGLTFADTCQNDAPEVEGICHVPEPGRPADVWWLGFDCGHFMDFMPGLYARERHLGLPALQFADELYRDLAYVRGECASLARQLARPAQGNAR
jgi:hypothetical protein